MMVNDGAASSGIEACGAKTTLSIVQDDDVNRLRNGLGAAYNSIIVVDGSGVLRHHIENAQFPAAADELSTVVPVLLP